MLIETHNNRSVASVAIVVNSIIQLMPAYIQFPYEMQSQVEIPAFAHWDECIKAPSDDAFTCMNGKGYRSINVQQCETNQLCVAQRRGSVAWWTYDSFILWGS
ncbi:hypothetical protein SKAU_G00075480 [Synaphobranchus kaupii]|uniref:Uncharacterized protein n=1 Tax=Synaphobranchus kaupii TaxID=118154 RepID=A0A9Q1JBQ3_SYNKA|nr:hypothetical protein SKAU_G00075480 [Synaphobranchus kaupii]